MRLGRLLLGIDPKKIFGDLFAAWRSGPSAFSPCVATGSAAEVAAMGEWASQASSGVARRTRDAAPGIFVWPWALRT